MNNPIYKSVFDTMNFIYNSESLKKPEKEWCLFGIYLTYGNIYCDTNNLSFEEHKNLSKCYQELINKLTDI